MSTAIVVHGDADGICSATIALNKYPGSEIWFTHPIGLLGDIKKIHADRVIICDLAISERDKSDLFSEFRRISSDSELIYIDHHPLPLDTLAGDIPATSTVRDLTKSASELTFSFLGKSEMALIALFGALADYYTDTTDFVRETLQVYDKRTIYLEAGILSQAIRVQGKRDYDFKRSLIRLLSNGVMPSTRPEIVRKAISGTRKEWETMEIVKKEIRTIGGLAIFENVPKGISPTKVAKFALGVSGKSIALSTRVRKRQYVDISARKLDSFSLDLNLTFRTIAPRFGGSGGGHPTAAGARIPKKHLTEFLNAVTKEVEAIP